jgi:hypothetical protein
VSETAGRDAVRTYGGWRRSRGMGLFGLSSGQTLAVLAALTVVLVAASTSTAMVVVLGPPAAALIAGTVLRIDGVPVATGLLRRLRWVWGTVRGYRAYRGGVTAEHGHPWDLPGVLAATELRTASDRGGDYGLVVNRRTGMMTATLLVAATSTWLVDRDQAGTWVSNWGGWLAGLGYMPAVAWVNVTVDTAPASGTALADQVSVHTSPHAPAAARRVLAQLVEASPTAAAEVCTLVSITFDPRAAATQSRDPQEAAAEISRLLPGLEDSLAACGVTVLGRATADQLAATVRSAFDPASRPRLSTPGVAGLQWADAGPVAAEESWDHYRHDGGLSVSWAWHEAPRQRVHADVLARLLAPGPHRKRVSMIYRPYSAADAARTVETEVNAAVFRDALRARQGRDENARDRADRDRALTAAREEAAGAGVGLMNLFVTVTVDGCDERAQEDLARAAADVESRAETAKLRLRRLWASQAAGFATTLPCGICPPQLAAAWFH